MGCTGSKSNGVASISAELSASWHVEDRHTVADSNAASTESNDDTAATSLGAADLAQLRERIVRLYEQFNPRKLKDVNALLLEWGGDEKLLLAQIETKYRQQMLTYVRNQIFELYQSNNPRKLNDVDALLLEWEGEEEQLLEHVRKKYADRNLACQPQPHSPTAAPKGESYLVAGTGALAGATHEQVVDSAPAWTPTRDWAPSAIDHERLLKAPTAGRKGRLPPLNI